MMSRKILFAVLAAMFGVVSCTENSESTFIGFEYDPMDPTQRLEYEDVNYACELDTMVNKLYTVDQSVRGNMVIYKGETELSAKEFDFNLNLEANFEVTPGLVYVDKKESLANVAMTSSDTHGEDEEIIDEGELFKRTRIRKDYEFFFNEGEAVNVNTVYEKMAHHSHEFDYSAIKNVLYKRFDARLNEEMSNADSTVYDVDLYFWVAVAHANRSETNMSYEVRVPVQRIYKEAPADAVTTVEDVSYAAEFATRENELYTVRQFINGEMVTMLRDEEIGRKPFRFDLNLNVAFEVAPPQTLVDSEEKLSDVALISSSSDDEAANDEVIDEFTMTTLHRNYEFNFNEGEVVNAESIYQRLAYGETIFAYSSIQNVSYKNYEAILNEELSNADEIVYDINLYFDVEVECKDNNALNGIYEVCVPMQRKYVPEKPDVFTTLIENAEYIGQFATENNRLYTVMQQINGDRVVYKNDNEEVSRESFSRDLNLEAIFSIPDVVYVEEETKLNNVSLSASSKDGDHVNNVEDDGFIIKSRLMDYHYKFNASERVLCSTMYDRLLYDGQEFSFSSIYNVRYNKYEASINEEKTNRDSTVYDVTLYFDVIVKYNDLETNSSNDDTYLVAVPYKRVYMHEDALVDKRAEDVTRVIIDEHTEKISWTEVEVWSVSGEKRNTMTYYLKRNVYEPSLHWVYTSNADYQTNSSGVKYLNESTKADGNWTVTTRYEEYSSVADNGANAFNNVYAYDYQKAVYDNEYYRLSFDYADWQLSEGISEIVATSDVIEKNSIMYNVSDYVNNVVAVYSLTDDSYTANVRATAKIAVEKPVDKIIPNNWGKIVGAGISAVPADDVGGDYAKKCICIRTENGAVAIAYDMDAILPSVDMITSGYFVEGEYSAEFDSGVYMDGHWMPAMAKDLDDRISYCNEMQCIRNIRFETLRMWNWRNGDLTTKINGYSFSVSNDGTLTIKYNGAVAMQIR
jgi:hypothetical protein